jgi:hypothetical protein
MGNCLFCGQKAGFFKKKHAACETSYILGKHDIIQRIIKAISETSDFQTLDNEISKIAMQSYINGNEIKNLYVEGFDEAVNLFLDDGILSIEEEEKTLKYRQYYELEQEQADKNGSLSKIIKAIVLRDILEGKIPESRITINGPLPIMLQNSEKIIWLFNYVSFYEQRTRTEYQGRSQGVSIKIAKGLYYRTGAFKGHPVQIEEMKFIGTGMVVLTNINFYFTSSLKNLKLPYNRIITADPYEDGIGLQKDGVNAKPQIFKGLDGWFIYNVISNLNQIKS